MASQHDTLPPLYKLREIAVRATCDPRTVGKFLEGKAVQPMVADRIRRALAAEGVTPQEPGGRHAA